MVETRHLALILVLLGMGARLQGFIADGMRDAWTASAPQTATAAPGGGLRKRLVHDGVRALRTSRAYRWTFSLLRQHVVPSVFGISMLALVGAMINRAAFEGWSSIGGFCLPSAVVAPLTSAPRVVGFDPGAFCQPTGIMLERRARYRIDVALPTGDQVWRDEGIVVTSPAGFGPSSRALGLPERLFFGAATPARRIWRADWFVPIARAGTRGADHYMLSTPCTTFTARKDGELFLFVNDAILPVKPQMSMPFLAVGFDAYYRNNRGGAATLTIAKLPNGAGNAPAGCRVDTGSE